MQQCKYNCELRTLATMRNLAVSDIAIVTTGRSRIFITVSLTHVLRIMAINGGFCHSV
jgi:hypothetical protein